jgi:DNA-binding response OmpR family regulator
MRHNAQQVTTPRAQRRLVLIDDDTTFCKIIAGFAESRGIMLDWYRSLQEMGSVGRLSDYSAAIVDFDLGPMNGVEIAEYLPAFFGKMPMLLISGKERKAEDGKKWPTSIQKFVHKDQGPDAILDEASRLLDQVSPWRN